MDRHTAVQVFVEVVDRGSLSAAAEALEMSRAMVSRYLESLERELGVRLLQRTTRRLSLTDAGEQALPRCRQLLQLRAELHEQLGQQAARSQPRGRLRISCSTSFAMAQLGPALADFLQQHPQVQVELLAADRTVHLVEERIDLALRISNRLDEGLVARRLATCRSVLCASPAYLRQAGHPAEPAELRAHRCISHANLNRGEYRLLHEGRLLRVPITGPLQSNEAGATLQAVLGGLGIAMLPTYLVGELLAQGRLQAVLPAWEPEPLGLHAVMVSRQHPPQLLRLMVDFLAERFAGEPWDPLP
ncbi:LysR substrate-binding domain-containing protein [Inhella sp.]|uniref:LysR family transcriptional regulator n=1 Tax=Inhella sp. TaxID=1921806 RepID=UPI0035B1381A